MARISMRNVQKSTVEEYFNLYLSSAAAKGVKDKTLETYKHHFRSIAKRLNVTVPMNRLTSQDLENMILAMREEGLSASSINSYTRTLKVFFSWCNEEGHTNLNIKLYKAPETVKGGYFKIWYRLYFPRQYLFHKELSDEDLQQLIQDMDDCATSALFRQICFRWLKAKSYRLFSEEFLFPENPLQHNILLNGEMLDFVQEGKHRTFYAKIWDSCTSGFPGYAFEKMEDATTQHRPFYDNEYALFSMRRVSAYCDKLRAFDNVQVFELRTMWGNKKDHLFDMD